MIVLVLLVRYPGGHYFIVWFTGEVRPNIFDGGVENLFDGLGVVVRHMRSEDHVITLEQLVILNESFQPLPAELLTEL